MPLLADDFWRIAHDEHTGRPRLRDENAALGLAAGLLAELMTSGNLVSHQGGLVVLTAHPPECPTAHMVLAEIRTEQQRFGHPLDTWLRYLARTSRQRVAERMARGGHVLPETRRGKLFGAPVTTYTPTDAIIAATPAGILSTNLRLVRPLNGHLAALAGLAWATGLSGRLLDGATDDAHQHLAHIVRGLWNPIAVLVSETRQVASRIEMSGL